MSTKLQSALINARNAFNDGQEVTISGYELEFTDDGKVKYKKEGGKRWSTYNPKSEVAVKKTPAKKIKKETVKESVEEIDDEEEVKPTVVKKPTAKKIKKEIVEESDDVEEVVKPIPKKIVKRKITAEADDDEDVKPKKKTDDYALRMLDKEYRQQYKQAYEKKVRAKIKIENKVRNEFAELEQPVTIDIKQTQQQSQPQQQQQQPEIEDEELKRYTYLAQTFFS